MLVYYIVFWISQKTCARAAPRGRLGRTLAAAAPNPPRTLLPRRHRRKPASKARPADGGGGLALLPGGGLGLRVTATLGAWRGGGDRTLERWLQGLSAGLRLHGCRGSVVVSHGVRWRRIWAPLPRFVLLWVVAARGVAGAWLRGRGGSPLRRVEVVVCAAGASDLGVARSVAGVVGVGLFGCRCAWVVGSSARSCHSHPALVSGLLSYVFLKVPAWLPPCRDPGRG